MQDEQEQKEWNFDRKLIAVQTKLKYERSSYLFPQQLPQNQNLILLEHSVLKIGSHQLLNI